MDFLLCLALLSLLLFSLTSANAHHPKTPSKIHQACQATLYPEICITTLSQSPLPSNPKPLQIIQYAVFISSQNLKIAQSMAKNILMSSNNLNRTIAAENCLEVLHNSDYRLITTAHALPRRKLKDARHWISAALQYQYDCWSFLYFVNTTHLVNETMAFLISLNGLTSNALSMIRSYDLFGGNMGLWKPPLTERSGFWKDGGLYGSDLDFKGGFPVGLTTNVLVCKEEGMGCVKTVQEAVNMAPDNGGGSRFVIKINKGVYAETVRVGLGKKNVVFLGDGIGKTVITGSLNKGLQNVDTYNSATVAVSGEGFMARDITFQNTAGPNAQQAVAFRSESDHSILQNCEFLGNQDTVYAHSLRQYYKSCRIEGNVDFIFGNSAAVFQDSVILVRPRQLEPAKGAKNVVTAQGRTDPAQPTGFVFRNCVINGTEEYMGFYYSNPKVHINFLGRPWKEYSRTVFIHCNLGEIIAPNGWMPWNENFALPTLYYGEFESYGLGANISGRVPWSNQIPNEHLSVYSVQNFIQGNEWIATSVS